MRLGGISTTKTQTQVEQEHEKRMARHRARLEKKMRGPGRVSRAGTRISGEAAKSRARLRSRITGRFKKATHRKRRRRR